MPSVVAAGGEASNPIGGSAGFDIVAGTTLTIQQGGVSGYGGILKTGRGVLLLQGTNSYSGATIINGGVLAIDSAAALGTNNRVIFGGTPNAQVLSWLQSPALAAEARQSRQRLQFAAAAGDDGRRPLALAGNRYKGGLHVSPQGS